MTSRRHAPRLSHGSTALAPLFGASKWHLMTRWLEKGLRAQHTDVPRRAAPPWTDEQDAELLRAIGAGQTAADVAPQLGRGPRAARARLRYLTGPTRQPTAWTEQEDAQLTAGYEQGSTYAELAEQLDRPPSAIATRIENLRRRGKPLAPRRPRWTDERRRKLAKRRRDGATLRQLEHEFSITRGTLTSQLRTLRRLGHDLGE